ncbi:MAG: DNA adenine methylase [Candidatus Methanomethylicaceae archaeon]
MESYRPLFPYFGGKSRIANIVWSLLGDVDNYIEPFFGSGAVLFMRPETHKGDCETVNDKNAFVANFWRAVKVSPEEVARYADNPVNEADLMARHIWLVKYGLPELRSRIFADPEYYNPKIAGWWAWGLCVWVGSGWCKGDGRWTEVDGVLVDKKSMVAGETSVDSPPGVSKGPPFVADRGKGLVSISCGVDKGPPFVGHRGRGVVSISYGVDKGAPYVSKKGQGIIIRTMSCGRTPEADETYSRILDAILYFHKRLRNVRVLCGDWKRVVDDSVLYYGKVKGVFLDPPYNIGAPSSRMYGDDEESMDVVREVNNWCAEKGNNENIRIVLCGYEGQHNNLEDIGWRKLKWIANRSWGSGSDTENNKNRMRERIWYSPYCLPYNSGDRWNHPTLW